MRRRFSLDIPETLEDACDPAMMALVVYDMQAGVVRQLPDGGAEAVERVDHPGNPRGCETWEDAGSWWHSGSIRRSCVNAR